MRTYSVLCVAVKDEAGDAGCLAVVEAINKGGGMEAAFTEADEAILETIAKYAAAAIDNCYKSSAIWRYYKQVRQLVRVLGTIQPRAPLEETVSWASSTAASFLPNGVRCSCYLVVGDELHTWRRGEKGQLVLTRMGIRGVMAEVVRRGVLITTNEAFSDPYLRLLPEEGYLCAPVTYKGGVVGLMEVY